MTVNSSNSSVTVSSSVPTVPAPIPAPVDRNHNVESVVSTLKKQEPKHHG
jgi:hypothetical protein